MLNYNTAFYTDSFMCIQTKRSQTAKNTNACRGWMWHWHELNEYNKS